MHTVLTTEAGLNLQSRSDRNISPKVREAKRANWPQFNLE